MKPLAPVLIVAPGDLHQQVINEGVGKFRGQVALSNSQVYLPLTITSGRRGFALG